jgi:hypothetical protein
MAATYKKFGLHRHSSSRRIVVVVVPPVDELDLVGPLQVFNSVNRLCGGNINAIEVVTNTDNLTVQGEGGVLTFVAKHHFNKVEGACDSVLLVCGPCSRSVRDAALSAWLKKMVADVRRLGAVCVGSFLLAEAGLLNQQPQAGGLGCWIRQHRCDEARLRSTVGDHSASLSSPRGTFDRRVIADDWRRSGASSHTQLLRYRQNEDSARWRNCVPGQEGQAAV